MWMMILTMAAAGTPLAELEAQAVEIARQGGDAERWLKHRVDPLVRDRSIEVDAQTLGWTGELFSCHSNPDAFCSNIEFEDGRIERDCRADAGVRCLMRGKWPQDLPGPVVVVCGTSQRGVRVSGDRAQTTVPSACVDHEQMVVEQATRPAFFPGETVVFEPPYDLDDPFGLKAIRTAQKRVPGSDFGSLPPATVAKPSTPTESAAIGDLGGIAPPRPAPVPSYEGATTVGEPLGAVDMRVAIGGGKLFGLHRKALEVWDLESGEALASVDDILDGRRPQGMCAAPDGSTAIVTTGRWHEKAGRYTLVDADLERVLHEEGRMVGDCRFTADGRFAVVELDRTLHILDPVEGVRLQTIGTDEEVVHLVDVHPTRPVVLASADDRAFTVDLRSGKRRWIEGEWDGTGAWSASGILLSDFDGKVTQVVPATGQRKPLEIEASQLTAAGDGWVVVKDRAPVLLDGRGQVDGALLQPGHGEHIVSDLAVQGSWVVVAFQYAPARRVRLAD